MQDEFSRLFQEYVAISAAKRTMLRNSKELDTLVVGSSHGDFGFDPSQVPGAFNMCCRSQCLKYSYNLYRKISEQYASIKNIVVFFSIFSPGSSLEKSPTEREIAVALNEIFDLDLSYEDPHLAAIYSMVKGKLGEMTIDVQGHAGFLPTINKGFFPADYGAARRVADHIRFNQRTDALPYLSMILDLAKQRNHRVIIVLSPARSDYKHHAGPGSELFRNLRETVHSHSHSSVRILDLYEHAGFDDADFCDFDHLQPLGIGTKFVSRLLRGILHDPAGSGSITDENPVLTPPASAESIFRNIVVRD